MTSIFVSGITGCQGGAVAKLALARGWSVSGLARDPASPKAIALAAQGVRLVEGDYGNQEALEKAMTACTAVFLVPSPIMSDPEAEMRFAAAILAAAKTAGTVTFVVASTSLGTELIADDDTSIFAVFMRSKRTLEKAVAASGFQYCILRPGNFMANFLQPKVAMYPGFCDTGVWTTGLQQTTRLPLVDEDGIAAFAVAAISEPARFHGQTIGVASDVLTPEGVIAVLQEVLNENSENNERSEEKKKRLQVAYLSDTQLEELRKDNPVIVAAYTMMRDMIGLIDVDAARGHGVQMGSFRNYVRRRSEDVKATFGV